MRTDIQLIQCQIAIARVLIMAAEGKVPETSHKDQFGNLRTPNPKC
jgi:hypothetical protein